MWILVLINLNIGQMIPLATDSMFECFALREQAGKALSGVEGKFPPGIQGVCINMEGEQPSERSG